MSGTVTLYDCDDPGLYTFRFQMGTRFYDAVSAFKEYPGCRYAGKEYGKGVWVVPMEGEDFLRGEAERLGAQIVDKRSPKGILELSTPIPEMLYPYQRDTVAATIKAWQTGEGGKLLNLELGLGKTVCALTVIRCALGNGVHLVVCPATVRRVWKDEIEKWCGDLEPEVWLVRSGKEARNVIEELYEWDPNTPKPLFTVVSYKLLEHFAKDGLENIFASMVADECHYLANEKAGRSRAWDVLRHNNIEALAMGLTGTPVPNRLLQLPGQVNAVAPGRFGNKWKFVQRYHYCTEGTYGGLVVGDLRQDRSEELHERLAAVSIRVTKHEVAHLLPKLTTQRVEIPYKKTSLSRQLTMAQKDFGNFLSRHRGKRISEAVTWIEDTGQSHVCALTYHIDTARALCLELQNKGYNAELITGEDVPNPDKRHDIIKNSLKKEQCFLVCSMKSVGIGIDVLAGYSTALFVELSYRMADVIQAMGRFYRLSSPAPVVVGFLLLRGTLDDLIMASLQPKLKEFAEVLKSGVTEEQLSTALGDNESEDEFFARMRALVDEGEWE